jgi:hypothetical protein
VVPISGPYLGSFNALPFGTQNDDGYELSATVQGQEINASDAYGLTLVEGVYRGLNWRLRMRGLEWNKSGLLSALQMFGQTGAVGTFNPTIGVIGERMSKFTNALLLTAILAAPPNGPSTPQTLTSISAMLSVNSRSDMLFTSKMREFPLEWSLIPYLATIGSNTFAVPFTTT